MTDVYSVAPAAHAPASKTDRAKALVEGYAHGMEHNAPRNPAELAELSELLGVKDEKKAAV